MRAAWAGRELTIHVNHPLVEISMLLHQDLWIPGCSHEKCVDTGVDWYNEAAGDLESDKEAVDDNHGGKSTALVVGWVGNVEVDVGNQSTAYGNEHASEGEDWSDKALYSVSVDVTSLDARLSIPLIRASMPRSLIILQVSLAEAK